jgi:regulator of sirC expression with transglutaminase-like and TPR domain
MKSYLEISDLCVSGPYDFMLKTTLEQIRNAVFQRPDNFIGTRFDQDFKQYCKERLSQVYQQPVKLEEHFLNIATNQQILLRLLTNLKYIYLNRQQWSQTIRTIELLLLLIPNHPLELRDRGLVYYQIGQFSRAQQDLGFYLALLPNAQDAESIRQLLQKINS